ncbi:MAG: oligosaccharide flippase family protein [Candidatus Binatia bacterium]
MSIRKYTAINVAGAVAPMAVMLITVPLYLRVLGEARYGVLALVWLALGYFAFLDLGLSKATANQVARAREAPATTRAEIFWTALTLNAGIGLLSAAILWQIGDYLLRHALQMPDEFRTELLAALPWMIAAIPVALVSSVLIGALEGRNRFLEVNALQVASNIAFQIIPLIVAFRIGPSLAVVIPAAVVSRAVMIGLFLIACYFLVPLSGIPAVSFGRLKSLLSYGGWIAVSSIVVPLVDTVERFIIGAIAGATAVTHYTIPIQLVSKLKVLPGALSRALFPRFSAESSEEAGGLASRSILALSVGMTLIVIVAMISLRPFLTLWVGDDIAKVSAPLGELLLVGIWFNSVAHVPYFLLQAQARPDFVAKLHAAELPVYVLSVWLAVEWAGLWGVALVWVVRCILEAVILLAKSHVLAPSVRLLILQAAVVCVTAIILGWFGEAGSTLRLSIAALLLLPTAWLSNRLLKIKPLSQTPHWGHK